MAQLYRKALLERMSSPEQLDKMLKVTSPMFWIALLGGGLMIAATLTWAILGRLPVKVEAGGVYVPDQGTYSVSTFAAGTVRQINVEIGDMVEEGQTVLTLAGDGINNAQDTEKRIEKVAAITLESTDDEITADNIELISIKAQLDAVDLDPQQKEAMLNTYRKELDALKSQVETAKEKMDSAFSKYIGSGVAADPETEREYSRASAEYNSLYSQQLGLEQNILALESQLSASTLGSDAQAKILAEQFEMKKAAILSGLQMQLEQHISTLIDYMAIAPVSGIVTDIKVNLGSSVMQGSEVMKIRQIHDGNDDIIQCYLPISQGKKVHEGMKVIVYPATVNKQEYGHMEAEVVSVDRYVSTVSSILNTLGDESLAASFSQSGPVVGVTCRLKTDESTTSGYWWSNRKGASITLEYGTPVMVDIITEEKAPISLILPFIKETLSL